MLMTASLVFSRDALKIRGEGPIAAHFNVEMVRRLFTMPSVAAPWHTPDPALGADSILPRLTKQAHDSLLAAIHSDPDLRAEYARRVQHYAAYAHPSTGRWPCPDLLMTLEYAIIDLPQLSGIMWSLDGSVTLYVAANNDLLTLTELEFAESVGMTYQAYCELHLPLQIESNQRVLSLLAVERTSRANVTYINAKSEVEQKTMVFWQSDQIDQYLKRHELSHLATDPE